MPPDDARIILDNRTELPDALVQQAVETFWVENAAIHYGHPTTFQSYAAEGSLLARTKFTTPSNVFDEIKLARDLAERDDDIRANIGAMLAVAFGEGMENFHEDEATLARANACAKAANLDMVLKECYREYLIAGSMTTVTAAVRERLEFSLGPGREDQQEQMSVPRVGVLPAETIRVTTNDLFQTGELAMKVDENSKLYEWLQAYLSDRTSEAKKAEMRREDPLTAALFIGKSTVSDDSTLFGAEEEVFVLNPTMVSRASMPKGAWAYPRPPLTSNFALLEAKRLLNIMDYSLLQGGTNYIVIAKKGTDQAPALPAEIANLQQQIRVAGKSGVLVGDHRLSIEVITPDLSELLSPAKRELLGRKLAQSLLRVPSQVTEDPGSEGAKLEGELIARVITGDRRDIKRHVESAVYGAMVRRNRSKFPKGAPKLWFPKIVLQGTQAFTDYVLKLRDRGDIPRKWAVEAGGFDYEAGLAQRQREIERGDDETLTPGDVPFTDPQSGPQDNQEGRPSGTSPGNGRNRPRGDDTRERRRTIRRTRGETVRAEWNEELNATVRYGELTAAILEEYPEHEFGRVTAIEREAIDQAEPITRGPVAVVPVNREYDVDQLRAVRLDDDVSLVVGRRTFDHALVAKALCFREPRYSLVNAEDHARRWGFHDVDDPVIDIPERDVQVVPPPDHAAAVEALASAMTTAFAQALASLPQPQVIVNPTPPDDPQLPPGPTPPEPQPRPEPPPEPQPDPAPEPQPDS